MVRAVIATPFEIWSAGMWTILGELDCDVVGRWAQIDSIDAAPVLTGADLLILAWRLVPQTRGELLSRPLNGHFGGKIILVLEPEDDFSADDFVVFDVEGLLLSSAPVQSVIDCIASVRRGNRWIDPGVRLLLGNTHRHVSNWNDLSSREREVASLAASGLSNKRIARALELSDGTVKMHIHHILAKLHLASRVELKQSPVE